MTKATSSKATTKATSKKANKIDEQVVKQVVEQKSFSVQFVEVLTLRNQEQFSADTETAISKAKNCAKAIDAVMIKPEFKEIASTLLKNARIADAKQDKQNFIAVKALVKIAQALNALGQGLNSQFDGYSNTIISNLIALNGITNKSALVALSKSIEYTELDQVQDLKARHNCSPNTASTQASSTRMMLKHLGLAELVKGKQNDITTICTNERAQHMVSLFVK